MHFVPVMTTQSLDVMYDSSHQNNVCVGHFFNLVVRQVVLPLKT